MPIQGPLSTLSACWTDATSGGLGKSLRPPSMEPPVAKIEALDQNPPLK